MNFDELVTFDDNDGTYKIKEFYDTLQSDYEHGWHRDQRKWFSSQENIWYEYDAVPTFIMEDLYGMIVFDTGAIITDAKKYLIFRLTYM